MLHFLQAQEIIKNTLKNNDAEAEKARKEKQKIFETIREENINNFLELSVYVSLLEEASKKIIANNVKKLAAIEASKNYNYVDDGRIIDLSLLPDKINPLKLYLQDLENTLVIEHNIDTEQVKAIIKEELKKKLEI